MNNVKVLVPPDAHLLSLMAAVPAKGYFPGYKILCQTLSAGSPGNLGGVRYSLKAGVTPNEAKGAATVPLALLEFIE